jgi:SHAQKYF class myb-like DNA-binding protein
MNRDDRSSKINVNSKKNKLKMPNIKTYSEPIDDTVTDESISDNNSKFPKESVKAKKKIIQNVKLTETENKKNSNKRKRSEEKYEAFPYSNNINIKNENNSGRWTAEEHRKFLEGLLLYKNDWTRIQKHIKTRCTSQVRSHAQKFVVRFKKYFRIKESEEGMTQKEIKVIKKDNQLKCNSKIYNLDIHILTSDSILRFLLDYSRNQNGGEFFYHSVDLRKKLLNSLLFLANTTMEIESEDEDADDMKLEGKRKKNKIKNTNSETYNNDDLRVISKNKKLRRSIDSGTSYSVSNGNLDENYGNNLNYIILIL